MNFNNSLRITCLLVCFNFIIFWLCAQQIQYDTSTVYFSFNSYSISEKALSNLQSQLKNFSGSAVKTITIVGYTDTTGSVIYNAALSLKRCVSVKEAVQHITRLGNNYPFVIMANGEDDQSLLSDSLKRRAQLVLFSIKKENLIPVAINAKQNKDSVIRKDRVIDTVIVLDNIYFEPDMAVLTPGSMNAFPNYVSVLKKYKNNDMEIGGHVNHTDSKLKETDPLFKLSEQRAKVVYQYLLDFGFDAAKLTYKGYGNSHLVIAKPANEDEKRKNMRVEITVYTYR
jgi:outer membrane protein OmpA-like peptidoglycan-associated protein